MPSLKSIFPTVKYPILSAPMAAVSGAALAIAVSKAGGHGFIGGGYDMSLLRIELGKVREAQRDDASLRVSFGVFSFVLAKMGQAESLALMLDLLSEFEEVVSSVWLFGGDEGSWIPPIKEGFPHLPVIVQVHTVELAHKAVSAGASIIVAQGSDAGGHAGAVSASIVSLVPELVKSLPSHIPVLAAGGIMTGAGIVAALALGAQGVVLGTIFMVSQESALNEKGKDLALRTTDGGRSTVQTRLFDEMRGTTDWPLAYTGRAVRNRTFEEEQEGREVGELRREYEVASKKGDFERVVCWAGTGVGLVEESLPAGEIVRRMVGEYEDAAKRVSRSLSM